MSTEFDVNEIIPRLAREYEDFNWWIPESLATFDAELKKELCKSHPLYGCELVAVARNDRNDDVLYGDEWGFCNVHLTWNQDEQAPFPLFDKMACSTIEQYLIDDYEENENSWGWVNCEDTRCENPAILDICMRGATIKVLSRGAEVARVDYKGEVGEIPASMVIYRPAPEFEWGDEVLVPPKGLRAVVADICWRSSDSTYFYYLDDLDGKPIKKRYNECDLAPCREL